MNKDNWKPDGVMLVTSYLTVTDATKALEFYKNAFDFEQGECMQGPKGEIVHASMKYLDTHVIMFAPEGAMDMTSKAPVTSGEESAVGFYLYCEDVDALIAQAIKAGAKACREIDDQFWGDRLGSVTDPFGYTWTIATKVGEFDPAKMPKFD